MTRESASAHLSALESMRSGTFLPLSATKGSIRIAVDATEFGDAEIPDLAESFIELQLHYPYIKPIFLVATPSSQELSNAGFIYETVILRATWFAMKMHAPYEAYIDRRFGEVIQTYAANRTIQLRPGQDIPFWLVAK